jgi:hypothetical protein
MLKTSTTEQLCVKELVDKLKIHLSELGYSPHTIERLDAEWRERIAFSSAQYIRTFTMELGRAFIWDCRGFRIGDKDSSANVTRAIHMLADFEQYGMVFKQSRGHIKGFSVEFKVLFEGFLEYLHKTGISDGSIVTWRSRLFRFEQFLQKKGISTLNRLKPKTFLLMSNP